MVSLTLKSFEPPKFSDSIPLILLPRLEQLSIVNVNIKNFTSFRAWKTPNLKEIFVSRHVELKNFEGISYLSPKLEKLTFRNMDIESFKGLTHISLVSLKCVEINCLLSDTALAELKDIDFSHVKVLYLHCNLQSHSKHVAEFLGKGGSKEINDLSYFPSLRLSNLVYLKLTSGITSLRGIEKFFLLKLKILDISESNVTSQEINRVQSLFGPELIILK